MQKKVERKRNESGVGRVVCSLHSVSLTASISYFVLSNSCVVRGSAVEGERQEAGEATRTQYDLIIQQLIARDRNDRKASFPSCFAWVIFVIFFKLKNERTKGIEPAKDRRIPLSPKHFSTKMWLLDIGLRYASDLAGFSGLSLVRFPSSVHKSNRAGLVVYESFVLSCYQHILYSIHETFL